MPMHAWESRLFQPKLSEEKVNGSLMLRLPGAEKIMGRSTYIYFYIYSDKCHENWRMIFDNK